MFCFFGLKYTRGYKGVVILPPRYKNTPRPWPLKKGTFDSNAVINSKGFGDMSSTQNNRIWSSANSFFRNRQKFACFLEHWPETLIAVNWQWSVGKNFSLSKNWDYWEIAENMVKMHNLVKKSCCKPADYIHGPFDGYINPLSPPTPH